MDKLNLSQFYAAAAAGGHHPLAAAMTAQAAAAQAQQQQQQQTPPPPPAVAAAGAGLGSVEAVSPSVVFDVASLVLYGTHAVPVRLKILLDRLFSVLREEEVAQILKGYGWTMEDYQRGYILKDPRGAPIERWTMCSKEEEPLVLQQFLRFGETRTVTQQLLLQELSDRQNEEQRARAQHEIKRIIERNSAAAAAAAAAAAPRTPSTPPTTPLLSGSNGLAAAATAGTAGLPDPRSPASIKRSSSPLSSHSPPQQLSPKMPGYLSTPSSSSSGLANGGSASPVSTSPLNRLQNMQPFEYRNKAESMQRAAAAAAAAAAAVERPIPPTLPPGMRMPHSGPGMPGPMGLPMMPGVSGVPASLAASYQNTIASMASKAQKESRDDALNLTGGGSPSPSESSASASASAGPGPQPHQPRVGRPPRDSLDRGGSSRGSSEALLGVSHPPKKSSRPSGDPHAGEDGVQQEMKKKFRDNIGISYVSPTTGKKRVQCNVCLKTFCDKGALKIHFSAVHLREMHKCTVDGCNMMFSSRRSRNRHSANPNPKLHTPHLRRKISPHDGRTHQGPYLPGLVGMGMKEPSVNSMLAGAGPGAAAAGAAAAAASGLPPQFAGMPPSMLPPELQNLQRQQLELARLHDMKMNAMYGKGGKDDGGASSGGEEPDLKRSRRLSGEQDSGDDLGKLDDDKSIGEHSGKDEASSGTHSITGVGSLTGNGGMGGGGRKRKSQNPTRIATALSSPSAAGANASAPGNEEDFSSDDDDEGFENPLEDNDDDLDNFEDDDDNDQLGGGSNNGSGGSGAGPGSKSPEAGDKPDEDGNNGKSNGGDSPSSHKEADSGDKEEKEKEKDEEAPASESNNNNNNIDETASSKEEDRASCASPASQGLLLGDIPVDKENPLRCIECGEVFANHFAVKTHFQEEHLKLMHKCTIEGCNAGFPSKRSRDRHSSNLNLHRKLLSTSSEGGSGAGEQQSASAAAAAAASYQSELLARLYAENAAAAAAAGQPGATAAGPGAGSPAAAAAAAEMLKGGAFGMLPFNAAAAMGFGGLLGPAPAPAGPVVGNQS